MLPERVDIWSRPLGSCPVLFVCLSLNRELFCHAKHIQLYKYLELLSEKEIDPSVCSRKAKRNTASVKHTRESGASHVQSLRNDFISVLLSEDYSTSSFFHVPFEQLLNPSIYPFSFTDWIRFMHKAPTHAIGLLMTGPYADTFTAMSNYFKYTGEGQSWADLWEVERGKERAERCW